MRRRGCVFANKLISDQLSPLSSQTGLRLSLFTSSASSFFILTPDPDPDLDPDPYPDPDPNPYGQPHLVTDPYPHCHPHDHTSFIS